MIRTAFFGLLILLLACGEEKKEGIKPEYRDLTEAVYASVVLEPADAYQVFANGQGILDEVAIEEGDLVKEGQTIARVQSTQLDLSLDNARLAVQLAEDQLNGPDNVLKDLENQIATTREQVRLDSINLKRQESLWSQGIGSKSAVENLELKYSTSSKRLSSLRSSYTLRKKELSNQVAQARNRLRQAQSSVSDFAVQALIDGKVYSVLKEAGELISPQTPIALIGARDSFLIKMQVDEVDVSRVKQGMEVAVSLDAYPDQAFPAIVVKILPSKDTRTQTFTVEGIFTSPPETMYNGLSGEANIILGRKENVLTVPVTYLTKEENIMTDKGETEVSLGRRNLEFVEVLSGLDTATMIYKPKL
jgi:multidrug efflux pump subunit AcrA (membrane-fusion protein)